MTEFQYSEDLGEPTNLVADVGYASPAPSRRWWPMPLFNVLGSTAIAYGFGLVILPTDAQAALGFLLYAPLCAAPFAFLSGLMERRGVWLVLCAACGALGVGVAVVAHASWDILGSDSDRQEGTACFGGVAAITFVPALLAALAGLGVAHVSRSFRASRHEPFTCPMCGHDLLGVRDGRCPECARPFTVAELRAAAGGEDDPGNGTLQSGTELDQRP